MRHAPCTDHTTDEDHAVGGDDLSQVHRGYVESISSLTGEEVWSSDIQGNLPEGDPLLLWLDQVQLQHS
jgi:hypothetical protein